VRLIGLDSYEEFVQASGVSSFVPWKLMANTFEILSGFLARYDDEVVGRESSILPAEINARIRSFARGQLSTSEQTDLVRQLDEHPDWVAALAAEVKTLRNPGESSK